MKAKSKELEEKKLKRTQLERWVENALNEPVQIYNLDLEEAKQILGREIKEEDVENIRHFLSSKGMRLQGTPGIGFFAIKQEAKQK